MINAGDVERAIIALLAADPALTAACPDGVYWDVARQGSTAFVLLSLSTSRTLPELDDGDTFNQFVYIVKAVALGTASEPTATGDERIRALLDHGTIDLTGSGGELMIARWLDRIRYTELVAGDTWQHRGGRYEVTVTPT